MKQNQVFKMQDIRRNIRTDTHTLSHFVVFDWSFDIIFYALVASTAQKSVKLLRLRSVIFGGLFAHMETIVESSNHFLNHLQRLCELSQFTGLLHSGLPPQSPVNPFRALS
eukprot:9498160-Pyramimonas_sp.AAC.1